MADDFEGLIGIPAGDDNFTGGISRLSDAALAAFLARLVELEAGEGGHKGRIAAVKKELKVRGTSSPEVNALVVMNQEITAAERDFGDGRPYDCDRLVDEILFYQNQAGAALLEMGRRLMVIKAHEEHGCFMAVLERLGIADRSARYAMLAAQKFGKRQAPAVLELGNEKLRALTVLDDDDIKELEKGGSLKGLGTLDDVARMTVRELRQAVRKTRTQVERLRAEVDKAEAEKKAEVERLQNIIDNREPLSQEELEEKAMQAALDDLRPKLVGFVGLVRYNWMKCMEVIQEAEAIPKIRVPFLVRWAEALVPELNGFPDLVRDLDEALQGIEPAWRRPEDEAFAS